MSAQSDDLMYQDEVREVVRHSYRGLPRGAGRALVERFYSSEELSRVPEQAIAWALGVGNPIRRAELAAGEVVLDLGCGGGIDTVLAAAEVGPSGRVIGLDFLSEMCERARAAAEEAGVGAWCEFEVGEMEDLALPDDSVDVVVSNGVLNLSPRKSRALAEITRVLRPGGRVSIVDLVVDGDLPPEVMATEVSWAGCIAGALSERVLGNKLERAGLTGVELSDRVPFGIDDLALYPLFTFDVLDLMRRFIPEPDQDRLATSITVRASKPAAGLESEDGDEPRSAWVSVRRLQDIPLQAAEAPGVAVRHLKRVEDVDLKVLDVEPEGSTPFHTHPHAHEGVVVGGAGALRLQDGTEPLEPGDTFSVRPNEPHAIVSRGPEPLRFVCMDCFVD